MIWVVLGITILFLVSLLWLIIAATTIDNLDQQEEDLRKTMREREERKRQRKTKRGKQ